MAYNANIPLATDLLSQSQADLRSNFQEINTFLTVNHESLNSVAPHAQGKHKQLEMPVQGAAVVTDLTQWAMTVANNTLGVPAPAIFLTPPISAQHPAGTPIDMTTGVFADPGYCKLPCGLIVKWATSGLITQGAANTVNLYNGGPGAPDLITTIYTVQITGHNNDGQAILTYAGFAAGTQRVSVTYDRSFGAGNTTFCKVLVIGK